MCPVVFDEFNRLTVETMENIVASMAKEGNFLCCTFNSKAAGRTPLPESIKAKAVELAFSVPDLKAIVCVMLGTQGFIECEDLSVKFMAANRACMEKCTKHVSYDFGLRSIKAMCHFAGILGRASDYGNEAQILANAMGQALFMRATAEDRSTIKAEVKSAFGMGPELPEAWTKGGINGAAAMVAATAQFRHGIAVSTSANADAFIAMIEKAMGATSIVVDGTPAGLHAGGDHSPFATAFKAARARLGPVNVILKGPLSEEQLKPLHTVLDDNKVLRTPSGSTFSMGTSTRVIIFDDCRLWGPAEVSRVGYVHGT